MVCGTGPEELTEKGRGLRKSLVNSLEQPRRQLLPRPSASSRRPHSTTRVSLPLVAQDYRLGQLASRGLRSEHGEHAADSGDSNGGSCGGGGAGTARTVGFRDNRVPVLPSS